MTPAPLGSVARDPAGGGLPGWYLPLSTPWAIGEKTIWPIPSCSPSGMISDSITRQIMLYCGWFEMIRSKPISSAIFSADAISSPRHSETPTDSTRPPPPPPLRDPDVQHLPLPDQVLEGADGLQERGAVVVAVGLVQIHVVG